MKATVSFMLRLLVVLALVGVAVTLAVKYIDDIVDFFDKVKQKLFKGGSCCGDENDYDDVDLEDVCLDPDCPCKDDYEG